MSTTPEQRQQWREDAEHEAAQRPISAYDSQVIYRILALLDALDAAERERDMALAMHNVQFERANREAAHAEKAEAALDRVRALADQWEAQYERWVGVHDGLRVSIFKAHATRLRAALDGGEDR